MNHSELSHMAGAVDDSTINIVVVIIIIIIINYCSHCEHYTRKQKRPIFSTLVGVTFLFSMCNNRHLNGYFVAGVEDEVFEVKRYWVECLHNNKIQWREKATKGTKYRLSFRIGFFFIFLSLRGSTLA